MKEFRALNPDYKKVVESVVTGMPVVRLLDLSFTSIDAGRCEILVPHREELTQGAGIFQAGIIGAIADIAGGSAAGTLLPPGHALMTCDYTVKLLGPAFGDALIARGEVVRPGKSLTVSRADVFARRNGREKLCATALVTTMSIELPKGAA